MKVEVDSALIDYLASRFGVVVVKDLNTMRKHWREQKSISPHTSRCELNIRVLIIYLRLCLLCLFVGMVTNLLFRLLLLLFWLFKAQLFALCKISVASLNPRVIRFNRDAEIPSLQLLLVEIGRIKRKKCVNRRVSERASEWVTDWFKSSFRMINKTLFKWM